MAFGMQNASGDTALTLTAQGAATVVSGAIAAAGAAAYVLLLVHVSAVTGTPTLNVSLEQSASGTGSWSAVPGSAIAQLSAAGNAVAFAYPTANYVRVTATVAGTTPAVTATVAVITFAE
jgi:hypothetical protein